MREILFKAKRLDNGEWAEGDLLHDVFVGMIGEKSEAAIVTPFSGTFPVDPETVCQYTCLTDSNGAKVFDGDTLKFTDDFNDYEWIGRMEFGNPNAGYTWGWQLVHLSGEEPNIDTLCWFDMEESGAHSEVIGNIYDEVNT